MAIIGRIRKRVGLLIAFVGISMILFILGDLVTSNKGIMGGNTDVLGEIGGEKVRYPEFEKKVEQLIENYKVNAQRDDIDQNTTDMLREQAWSMTVNDLVLGKEYKKLGINVSNEELYDMVAGKHPHQQVVQAFTNKETGQFNSADVVRFIKDLPNRDESIQRQWKNFEDAIREERIAEKYRSIIKKGIYATTAEAKENYVDGARSATIRYLRMDYSSISDSSAKVEDSDLKKYYNDHQKDYKQDATARKVEYVAFDVKPSEQDKAVAEEWINKKKDEFAAATNDSLYVNQNSDTPFDKVFHKKGELPANLDTVVFTASTGTVIGPYLDGTSYKVAKVTETRMQPDSVKARHILLKIENNDTTAAKNKADSIKGLIKKGQKFEDLARIYSTDKSNSDKGGDLGWFPQGQMVPEFNDAAFEGKKGDMPIVVTQFGVHIMEIQDKGVPSKQVRVAVVERKVEPSQKTYDAVYNQAQQFAMEATTAEKFDTMVIKQGLNKRIADNIREADKNIAGLDQPRELVRWAYKASKDEVSKVFTFGDKYVVAKLTDIKEKGTLPMEEVIDQVRAGAIKVKKGEMLTEKYNSQASGATSIDAAGQKMNLPPMLSPNVLFSNAYIEGAGNEPRVVGTIFASKANQLSKPVKGENAVIVFTVDQFTDAPAKPDYAEQQKQLIDNRGQRSEYEVFNALKEKANVVDNRGKFY